MAKHMAPQPKKKRTSPIKTILKLVLAVLLVAVATVGAYVAYLSITYYRIDDGVALEVTGPATAEAPQVEVGQPYTAATYNIGFGAYEPDYGFFMDGGDQSWAWSKERLDENLSKIASFLKEKAAESNSPAAAVYLAACERIESFHLEQPGGGRRAMSDDELEVMRSAMNQAVEDQLVILQSRTMVLATAVSGSPFLASVPPDVRCGRLEQYRTNTSIHTYYDESAKISLVTEEYHFSGDRNNVRMLAAKNALILARECILEYIDNK